MLCDFCHKQKAVLFLDHVSGNDRRRVSFCIECGVKAGIMTPDLKIDLFPKKLIENLRLSGGLPAAREGDGEKCPRCGTERKRFLETRKAGCSRCWDLFVGNTGEFAKSGVRYAGKGRRSGRAPVLERGPEKNWIVM